MNLLFDSDVLIDFLARREPFDRLASVAWSAAEDRLLRGQVSSLSFTNIYYITSRMLGKEAGRAAVVKIAKVFVIAAVDGRVISQALASGMPDFEDAVQAYAGAAAGATHVRTRDAAGFTNGPLAVLRPQSLLALLASGHIGPT